MIWRLRRWWYRRFPPPHPLWTITPFDVPLIAESTTDPKES